MNARRNIQAPDVPKSFLDSLADNVVILDDAGVILATNDAWRTFAGENGLSGNAGMIGENYLDAAHNTEDPLAEDAAEGIEAVIDGKRATFELEYPCHSPETERWFQMRVSPFEQDNSRYVTVTHTDITERKQNQHELEESQERFRQLADNLEHVFWIIDAEYNGYEYLSPHFEELWGRSVEDFENLPEDFLEIVHPEDRDRVRRSFDKQTEGDYEIEYRIRRPDDETRWVRDRAFPITDDDGSVVRVAGISEDITEQKQRQNQLRKKERRYQAVFNDPNILVGLISPGGEVLDINQTAMEYVDETRQDLRGKPFWETPWFNNSESTQNNVRDWVRRAADGEYVNFEADLVRPDGEDYTVEGVFRPVTNEDGDVVSILVSDRDITEQKEMQKQLARSERRFRKIAQNINEAFFLISPDYEEVLYVNPPAEDIYGVPLEKLRSDPTAWERHVHPEDLEDIHANMDEEKMNVDDDFRIVLDGETRWLRARINPIVDDEGTVETLVGVCTDITKQKRAEQNLKENLEFLDAVNDELPGIVYQFRVSPGGEYSFPYLSEGYEAISGVPAGEATTNFQRAIRTVHPDDVDPLLESIEDAIETASPWHHELRFQHPDKGIVWAMGSARPTQREDGSLIFSGVIIDITERKELENNLELKNTRQELAQEIADLGHWSISLPDREVHWSDQTYRILGLEPSRPSPRLSEALEYYHEDDRPMIEEKLENAIRTGEDVQFKARLMRPEGEVRHVEVYGVPRTGEDNNPCELFGVIQDITDFKKTEQELKESELRFRQMAENIDSVFWLSDPDKEMIYVSPAFEDIWGISVEELYDSVENFLEMIHPEDRDRVRKAMYNDQITGDYDEKYRIERPDGTVRWVRDRAFPVENDEGEVHRIVGIAEDITEMKNLQREREKFVELVEHSRNFIVRANLEEELTYINEAGLDIIGVEDPGTILGEPIRSLHPEEDLPKHERAIQQVKQEGQWHGERQLLDQKTGETIEVLFDGFVINDPETGEPLEFAAVATNISQQIEIEEQLRKMVHEKETLLQEVHHRVKNNLQVVLGLIGLQAREMDNDQAVDALENSKRRIQSMAMIHEKLYEGAQLSTLDFGNYVEDLLERIVESYPENNLRPRVETSIQPANLDPDTVISCGLILNELVSNSIKHGFDNQDDATIEVEFFTDDRMNYHLHVADNGKGFEPDELEEAGSLGMRLVRNLTRNQLHGDLEFSQENGLEVEIVFPPEDVRYTRDHGGERNDN